MMNRPMRGYSGAPMGRSPMMANPYANPYVNPRNQAPLSPRQIVERLDLDRRQRLLRPITLGTFILSALLVPAVVFPTPDMGGLSAVTVALIGSGLAYLLLPPAHDRRVFLLPPWRRDHRGGDQHRRARLCAERAG